MRRRSSAIIDAIRAALRSRGMSSRQLADAISVSEPTIKRWLGRGEFSLRRLDDVCEALDLSLADLLDGGAERGHQVTRLSEKQERALLRDTRLVLVTYLLVNDWTLADIRATFSFDENAIIDILLKLDTLGIVDYRPPNRVRKLTARNFAWRSDGPVQAFFLSKIVPEFLGGPFDAHGDSFQFAGGTLSVVSRARLGAAIAALVREFEDAARKDARLPLALRDGCSLLIGFRGWEFSGFTRLRRPKQAVRAGRVG